MGDVGDAFMEINIYDEYLPTTNTWLKDNALKIKE